MSYHDCKKGAVREEGSEQVGFSLRGAGLAASRVGESGQVEMGRVGQGFIFK